jgi:hypothetical protein
MLCRSQNRGSAILELVIAVPILVLIAIGVAEFGRLYRTSIALSHAVKTGAQYGAQDNAKAADAAGIAQMVRNDASPVTLDSISSSRFCRCPDGTSPDCGTTCPGYGPPEVFVRVRAKKTQNFILRYPGLPPSVVVVDTAVMRIQ